MSLLRSLRRYIFLLLVAAALSLSVVSVRAEQSLSLSFAPAPAGTGETMFSGLVVAPDGKVYMATCNASGGGAHLISYDPKTGEVKDLADMRDVTGEHDPELQPQSKIHTQLVLDKDGNVWLGTHNEQRDWPWVTLKDFPKGFKGGHLISYNPKTGEFTDHGIPVPQAMEYPKDKYEFGESMIGMAIDKERGIVYALTHPRVYFVAYDIASGSWYNAGTILTTYPPKDPGHTTPRDLEVAADGNVYFFTYEGQLMRFNRATRKLERFELWVPGSDGEKSNMPYELAIDPTGTRIYGNGSSSGKLFELVVQPGKERVINDLGPAWEPGVGSASGVVHAITVGLDGNLYYAPDHGDQLYSYDPATRTRDYLGPMTFTDSAGSVQQSATWAAWTGPDGSIYFGGIAHSSEDALGITRFIPSYVGAGSSSTSTQATKSSGCGCG